MMFLARIVPGRKAEVFALTGALFIQPRAWLFCSYRQGSCAIAYTRDEALQAAKRKIEQPREVRPALRVSVQRGAW
jgi:hypothetical protein